jgi:HD-GYP domain-containing protein (c-di-GMP phosphodiesterase class II)
MSDPRPGPSSILGVVAYLNAAISNARLYAADHPQVRRYLERSYTELARCLRAKSEITFLNVDQDLVVDNQPLAASSTHVTQFVQMLARGAVERITFFANLKIEELAQLVADLSADGQPTVRSTPHIQLGKVQVRVTAEAAAVQDIPPEMADRIAAMGPVRDYSIDQLKELYHNLKASRIPPVSGFEGIVQAFVMGMTGNVPPLQILAHLKSSDEYTFTHAVNVCILTMAQAEALGISGRKLHDIGIAASLHDAGKVFVPEEILNKPGKLTQEEWVHMRSHTVRGARQILRIEGIPKVAFIGALEHHIRYDGSGYPSLGQWRPSLVSQMIAIADAFDAMRSQRPYQAPKPDAMIIEILHKESGTAFNPLLVENFLRLLSLDDPR